MSLKHGFVFSGSHFAEQDARHDRKGVVTLCLPARLTAGRRVTNNFTAVYAGKPLIKS